MEDSAEAWRGCWEGLGVWRGASPGGNRGTIGRFGGGVGAPGRLNRGPDAGCVGAGVGNEGGGGGMISLGGGRQKVRFSLALPSLRDSR